MLLANMNWLGALCTKLAGVKGCVMVKKSILGEATPGDGEVGEACVKFF